MIYLKDEEFIRGNCPMTKEEVRILSIAKMELKKDSKVLDIGAGTGSISIQASEICTEGKILGIEKEEHAIEILLKNKEKFQAHNFEVIKGEALNLADSIEELFDAIFIGGSGGNIEDLIKEYSKKLKAHGKFVLNFITIENVYKTLTTLKELDFNVECTQIAISKTKGKSYMLFANNPIFIVSANKA